MPKLESELARPIFVLGSPRSGTTVLGSYIGSSRDIFDIGEYRAFFATHLILPELLQGISPPEWDEHRARYLEELQDHAADFADRVTRDAGCMAYCDSSPRNVLIAPQLAERFPQAIFVLALRHYSGVMQSLARSGWSWAGQTWRARAEVWRDAYLSSLDLPTERTIVVSYDRLCAEPGVVIRELDAAFDATGFDPSLFDPDVLAVSHAPSGAGARPTILVEGHSGLTTRPSYDPHAWTDAIEAEVEPVVRPVEALLRHRWLGSYCTPPGFSCPDDAPTQRLPG